MNLPKSIKVGGQIYTIKKKDNCDGVSLPEDMVGEPIENAESVIDYRNNTISIRKDIPKGTYLESVLLHEICHALFEHCALENTEENVQKFSNTLHMFLVDNPKVLRWS